MSSDLRLQPAAKSQRRLELRLSSIAPLLGSLVVLYVLCAAAVGLLAH